MAENITIARPYAQAIFSLAQEQGDLKGWSEMLQFAAAVAADEDMVAIIDSPRFDSDQLANLFIEICGEKLNAAGKNMIRVLAENDRLSVLPEVAELFEAERAAIEGTIVAEVTSATALNEAQQRSIADALKKRLGRDVTLECQIDESLLGGAIIRAGDVVIDGSVVAKLEKLTAALAH
ncbi:MAG: F0F1 ATP synthase subunit delta [Gammaproteobacteria bacterium]|nr:F0F1 ATP synthase subunit delta [Gammaproteobacteria bacterium]MCW8840300.1 F0F1 ATP synthase subunit delta [Gammaproteobacteria bacterium]MCW8928602.1 F0F1 ATP synthase subunit delta [Gammaproteobacteria bacterium]MCW8958060.1 F0F1 ATP synthase subunit delta [Gammaproteobacteria bacterium]MCW8972337.1 F0F1 ATP synthase subunit delta [Gammaproteobacteria bacterium]